MFHLIVNFLDKMLANSSVSPPLRKFLSMNGMSAFYRSKPEIIQLFVYSYRSINISNKFTQMKRDKENLKVNRI